MKKSKESLCEKWDTIKRDNLCIIGVPEGEKKEKAVESLFREIMDENFPNMGRDLEIQLHEANRSPNKFNLRSSLRHIMIQLLKIKDTKKMLKATREKKIPACKGNPIRLSTNFLAKTLQARREWDDIFQVLKEKTKKTKKPCQPRILSLALVLQK